MARIDPTLSGRAVGTLVSGLRALGHDPAVLLANAGIDPGILTEPDARVAMTAVLAFIGGAVQATGDDDLGLHLAERAAPESFDVHLYAMSSSGTLREAYALLPRYQRLIHESTRVELDPVEAGAIVRHRMPGGATAPRQSIELVLAAWVRAGRIASGVAWSPTEVRFAHPKPVSDAEHRRFFGAPVRFATGENAVVLSAAVLALPCVRNDPALFALLDRYAEERLAHAPAGGGIADRAREALQEELRRGSPAVGRLAGRMKMSVRTLERGLSAEGTSYRELLDRLRHERAVRLLDERRVAIAEIAFLLGFEDLSSFYRAFRRWTGVTPAAYRQKAG